MPVKIRTVRHIMTSGAPARSLGRKRIMVLAITDHREIGLDMAAQAQIRVAGKQHLVIDRSVHLMTGGASFA